MAPSVGQLRAAGLAKEVTVGTLVTPPTEFIPYIAPDSFMPSIELLESTAIRNRAEKLYKAAQGQGDVKGMKLKWEMEPENIGNLLMGVFGTDTVSEYATYVIDASNNKIDFKESGGSQLHATIASGTYAMGTGSGIAGSLCEAIKTALDAAGDTYTIAFNTSTRKLTITPSSGTIQILWLTGTNNATSAYAVLGFTKVDTTDASSQTSNSTTAYQAWQHLFTRLQNAQLPSYSWWFDKNPKYMQFLGCMVSKLDLMAKVGEFAMAESEWTGLSYDDNGTSQSPSYSTVPPWVFNMVQLRVAGGLTTLYDNVKVSFDNYIKADHVLNSSIYPGVIYSEGFDVTMMMDLIIESVTEYNKFLAGTAVALDLRFISASDIPLVTAGTKYMLTIDMPSTKYSIANYPNPPGLLKVAFTARGIYDQSTTKIASAALVNSRAAAY